MCELTGYGIDAFGGPIDFGAIAGTLCRDGRLPTRVCIRHQQLLRSHWRFFVVFARASPQRLARPLMESLPPTPAAPPPRDGLLSSTGVHLQKAIGLCSRKRSSCHLFRKGGVFQLISTTVGPRCTSLHRCQTGWRRPCCMLGDVLYMLSLWCVERKPQACTCSFAKGRPMLWGCIVRRRLLG